MIGLVFVANGGFGQAMLADAESTLGPQKNAVAVNIGNNDDTDQSHAAVLDAIKTADGGKGVIVMIDVPHTTQYNIALRAMNASGIDAVALAGVNMPKVLMVVAGRSKKDMTPTLLAEKVMGDAHTQAVMIFKTGASAMMAGATPAQPGPLGGVIAQSQFG